MNDVEKKVANLDEILSEVLRDVEKIKRRNPPDATTYCASIAEMARERDSLRAALDRVESRLADLGARVSDLERHNRKD